MIQGETGRQKEQVGKMVFWKWRREILVIYVLLIITYSEQRDRTHLSILGLLPVTCKTGQRNLTAGVLPALHLALEHLYRHSWILKNYELQVTLKDSQVNGCGNVYRVLY